MYTVHTRPSSPFPRPAPLGLELRVQGDLGNAGQRFRHGAAALRLFRGLLKARLVEAGHLAAHAERHLGDRGRAVHHVHGACGGGLDARHRLPGLFQSGREGHAEAGRVRRGGQLFGVGALRSLEPGGEGVRPAERAARGPEVPLAVLELSFPDGRGLTGRHRLDSSWMVRGVKSGGSVGLTLRFSGATGDRSPAMATKKLPRRPANKLPAPRRPVDEPPESLRLRYLAGSVLVDDLTRRLPWYHVVLRCT